MRSSPPAAVRPGRMQRWWLDRSVRAKGMIVVAVPLIALIAVTSASLALQHNERQERSVALTASALTASAQQVLADAVNAETGVRGYAATGDPLFLQPYNLALTRIAGDRAALRAAAVAEGDSRAERTAAATTTKEMAELAQLRSAISAGASVTALRPALENGKTTMDTLRGQTAALAQGPAAINLARRADITRMESTIDWVSIAGLALGVLAGLIGVALFGSGISRRVTRAAANADRLGEGQPLEPVPVPSAGDELGRLARSLTRAEKLLARRTTELITARDEAVTATQAKNAFLSSTSHELRTPLNAVLGFAQLLQLSDLSQEDQEGVERILAAGHHLLALINELIDIARIESGEFSLSVEPVAVQPVVEETCQLMAPLAADRSITISQDCPPPGLAVNADRQRLRQILVNLVSNAIKYNRAGGTITLTCQAVAPTRSASRWPTPGREYRPLTWTASSTRSSGSAPSRPRSRAPGSACPWPGPSPRPCTGTSPPPAPRAKGRPSPSPCPGHRTWPRPRRTTGGYRVPRTAPDDSAGESIRVLYIEDNPANIEVVARFLKTRPGMRLQSATSGQAGLEAATREIPDLILLDLHLPGLHGDEVLRRLRAKPATAGIPVAILSAEASPAIIRRMRASGVIAYLTKPLDLTELGQLLDSVAAGHDHQADPALRTAPAP